MLKKKLYQYHKDALSIEAVCYLLCCMLPATLECILDCPNREEFIKQSFIIEQW